MTHYAESMMQTYEGVDRELNLSSFFSDMSHHSNAPIGTILHGGTHTWLKDGLLTERITAVYSPVPQDIVLPMGDDVVVLIDNRGLWMSTEAYLGKEAGQRVEDSIDTLPHVDRQETLPVFSMISDLNISPEMIFAYLEGEGHAPTPVFTQQEKERFSRTTPEELRRIVGRYQRTIPPELEQMERIILSGEVMIVDGECEWATTPHFSEILDRKRELAAMASADPAERHMLAGSYLERGLFARASRHTKYACSAEHAADLSRRMGMDEDECRSTLLNNHGYTLLCSGRTEEAEEVLREALSISPTPYVHNNLATALQVQGDLEGAIHHYERELEVNPSHETAERSVHRVRNLSRML